MSVALNLLNDVKETSDIKTVDVSHLPIVLPPHRDDFNIKVLQAFVELHEFADLNLVQALR